MNPERSGVCSGSATPSLPLLCFVVLNLCPPGSVIGLLFLFSVGISVSNFVCLLLSFCTCFSVSLSFSDSSFSASGSVFLVPFRSRA